MSGEYEQVYFSGGPRAGEIMSVQPGVPAIVFPRLRAPRLVYRDEDEFGPTFDHATYYRTNEKLGDFTIFVYAGYHEDD